MSEMNSASNTLRVTLTDGAVRNGYIHFPLTNSIFGSESYGDASGDRKGKPVTLIDEMGKTYEDDVRVSGNTGRLRARFGNYFSRVDAKDGDVAEITRTAPGKYSLRILRSGLPSTTEAQVHSPLFPEQHLPHIFVSSHMQATNTILYGPPGTGKTYSTIIRAMSIVDGIKYSLRMEPSEYDQLKRRFDQFKSVGQIEFVTFHQSYGYEDFMQGIRPKAVDGQIYYAVEDGVLKRIASRALHEQTASHQGRHRLAETETDFDASVRSLKAAFAMAPGNVLKFSFFGDASGEARFNEEMQAIDLTASEAKKQMSVPLATIKPLWDRRETINVPSDTGQPAESLFVLAALSLLKMRTEQVDELDEVATEPRQFVLIIDEINRGNISKIFGELITLVEPDKRIGARYETRVTLPHTSEESEEQSFGLPSNLHLVGTMNTADRSIALLDTALRRRFEFEELMPDASLLKEDVGGVDLTRMLEAINQRIEVLYDRDHTIGHAYLMGVSNVEELRNVFRHRVLPLLQEYFYENWSKIRSVLNDTAAGDFVVQHKTVQLSSDDIDGDESDQRPVYSVNRAVFPIEAFKRIYGK